VLQDQGWLRGRRKVTLWHSCRVAELLTLISCGCRVFLTRELLSVRLHLLAVLFAQLSLQRLVLESDLSLTLACDLIDHLLLDLLSLQVPACVII